MINPTKPRVRIYTPNVWQYQTDDANTVVHYKFSEASGNPQDSTGNQRHVTTIYNAAGIEYQQEAPAGMDYSVRLTSENYVGSDGTKYMPRFLSSWSNTPPWWPGLPITIGAGDSWVMSLVLRVSSPTNPATETDANWRTWTILSYDTPTAITTRIYFLNNASLAGYPFYEPITETIVDYLNIVRSSWKVPPVAPPQDITPSIPLDTWTQLVVVHDKGDASIHAYVNKSEIVSLSETAVDLYIDKLVLGLYESSGSAGTVPLGYKLNLAEYWFALGTADFQWSY